MSMNQHYPSDHTPWWTTQQEHPYQPMLTQATDNPTTSPSNYSWPSQLYHPHQAACFNSSNSHDPNASAGSHHRYHTTSPPFNLNIEEEEDEDNDDISQNPSTQQDEYDPSAQGKGAVVQEREPMFEKPLTPSDVGKLNRLVIPKQHAEKYFPLSGESAQQKGLLLSFEDESGKCWKFRYSYWNSSQSYVLTKGWSRYVKEKRLDAGDIVLFERDPNDPHRSFICWRRRRQQRESAAAHVSQPVAAVGHTNSWDNSINMNGANGGVGMGWTRVIYSPHPYPAHQPPPPYQSECLHAGKEVSSQTTSVGSSSKVLRLFGVNMECQSDGSEPSTPSGSSMSSHALTPHQYYHPHQSSYYSQTAHDHMDITVHRDVNQTRNRRG